MSIIDKVGSNFTPKDERFDSYLEQKKLFSLNRFFSNFKVFSIFYLCISIIIFFIFTYAVNVFYQFGRIGASNMLFSNTKEVVDKGILNAFKFWNVSFHLYVILVIVLVIGYIKFSYDIRTSFKELNVGQKGTSRWTSREELKKQYKAVPKKDKAFSGGGGVPIARDPEKDLIYIDDSPTNNLIVGMSRSGKGETTVFPMVDIYSRAERQASMVITDPKLELSNSAIPILEKRGYECHLLNLVDPLFSMGYNPLTKIIEEFKAGNVDDAQMLVKAFSFSIFNPDEAIGDSKFFADTSAALLSALILALIEDCLEEDKLQNQITKYLFSENYDDFIDETTKKEKELNMYSVVSALSSLSSKVSDPRTGKTELDIFFNKRKDGSIAKNLYSPVGSAGDRQKGNILSSTLSGLTVFMPESIAKMTTESTFKLGDLGFGKKPVAIFIGLPDYEHSNAFLATAFINQVYFTLAKMATNAPGGKSYREVIFLLDEFGNIPPIPDMETNITVCLGRNIRFNMFIQSYSQLIKLYGEPGANTIEGNCGNQIYIQSADMETAEKFSSLLGSKTISVVNRSGKKLSTTKEFTEMSEERRLLSANELMQLRPGEIVVHRTMKRTDLKNNHVRPYPIANLDKYRLEYRYEYMLDSFPSDFILYDSPDMRKVFADINFIRKQEYSLEMQKMIDKGETKTEKDAPFTNLEPKIADVKVEDCKHIDLSVRFWKANDYINRTHFLRRNMSDDNTPISEHDINLIFDLIGYTGELASEILEGKYSLEVLEHNIKRIVKNEEYEIKRLKGYVYALYILYKLRDGKRVEESILKEAKGYLGGNNGIEEVSSEDALEELGTDFTLSDMKDIDITNLI